MFFDDLNFKTKLFIIIPINVYLRVLELILLNNFEFHPFQILQQEKVFNPADDVLVIREILAFVLLVFFELGLIFAFYNGVN